MHVQHVALIVRTYTYITCIAQQHSLFPLPPVPNVAPIIDEALTLRLDGTHLLLTIVPLDPIQARGLVSEYIVSLTPVDPSQRMQGPSGSIQAGSTSTVIGGLNSDKAYSVAVAARTGAGLGIASVGFEVSSE